MKLTNTELKQIIKEEVMRYLTEAPPSAGKISAADAKKVFIQTGREFDNPDPKENATLLGLMDKFIRVAKDKNLSTGMAPTLIGKLNDLLDTLGQLEEEPEAEAEPEVETEPELPQ